LALGNKRKPTIIDVARSAGVSKTTVARVLARAENVSEATREQVLQVVRRLDYEPNALAVGMRSGRTGMLGLVVPDIANPFWAEVTRGAQDLASAHDLSVLVFSSNWDPRVQERHLTSLRQARVDGAVINPVADEQTDFTRLDMPHVLVGSSAGRFPASPSVGTDIEQGVRLGLDFLFERGHTAPALILGPASRLARERLLRAVWGYCREHGIDPSALNAEDGGYTVDGGAQAMTRLLKQRHEGHLCVFAANDLMALGALTAVRETGLRCPQDVSILGFDGIAAGGFAWPGLTTIEKPAREIGTRAVVQLLSDPGHIPARTYLRCQLIERGSVADLNSSLNRRN
jgi:LacI family transcriptional regulator